MNMLAPSGVPTPMCADLVADAWRLRNPLRFALGLLLDCGKVKDQAALLRDCLTLVDRARAQKVVGREFADSPLLALPVAEAFKVQGLIAATLIELRWAGLAGTDVARRMHLDVAIDRITAALAAPATSSERAAR
jgi:hypothetical protein